MKNLILLLMLTVSFNALSYDAEFDAVQDCIEEVEIQHDELDIRDIEDMKLECSLEIQGV